MPPAGVGADAQPAEPRTSAAASNVARGRHFTGTPFFSDTPFARLATEKT
jgi:hypothetical protein